MLSGCDSFDNTEPAARKGLGSKAASGRFAYEMLSIDFIKDLEISHVGEEAGCFDDIHYTPNISKYQQIMRFFVFFP